jgi:hypothetical protein
VRSPTEKRCAFCGRTTRSGIFLRMDPARVPYPNTKDD